MGGDRSLVRYHGYFVLGVVVAGGAALATVIAAFPEVPLLRPFLPMYALLSMMLISSWVGLAGFVTVRSLLRRRRLNAASGASGEPSTSRLRPLVTDR